MPKIIIDLSEEQYKGLKNIPYGSIASKIIYDKIKQGAVIVDGEYIKKEEALQALHDFWDEYLGYDGDGRELMLDNESVINSLPTYSFPNSVENKGDLISRQAVLDEMDKRHAEGDCITKGFIKALPSVENKGEWKMPVQDDGMSDPIYYQVRCSQCGFDIDPQTWYEELHQFNADNFCPNCGADMRGKADDK